MAASPPDAAPLVDLPRLVGEWSAGIRIIHIAHTRAAADYGRWEKMLGLSVAILTAISGSTVFAAADTAGNETLLFAAGALAIVAAVAAAAHTFLGFGALAALHAAAARDYGVLRKEFEATLACPEGGDLCAILQTIRTRWGEIEAKYPFVSQKRYATAQQVVAKSAERRQRASGDGLGA
jgi:predicted secreted protein